MGCQVVTQDAQEKQVSDSDAPIAVGGAALVFFILFSGFYIWGLVGAILGFQRCQSKDQNLFSLSIAALVCAILAPGPGTIFGIVVFYISKKCVS